MFKKMKDQLMRKLEDQASCSCDDMTTKNTGLCCDTESCNDTEIVKEDTPVRTSGCCGSNCC